MGKSLSKLEDRHRVALSWFRDNAGSRVGWPLELVVGSEKILLACRPKGIYKPKWMDYALSVRVAKEGNYADRQMASVGDAWKYEYHQEGHVGELRRISTNQGLISCLRDAVPVGVLRQVEDSGSAKYLVLGLAYVEGFCGGFFHLRGAHGGPT